jgi:lysozyme
MNSVNDKLCVDLQGIDLVRLSEGLRLKAYPDPGSHGAPWTIGYGHTGPEVHEGLEIDQSQAEEWLMEDIASASRAVKRLVTVPLTQGQFNALVDFTFNLGALNLSRSTLLRRLNMGDYQGANAEFKRWVYSAGRVMDGLVIRRRREADLFDD